MEGNLLKWTNYFNGWQMRYFILEGAILSYYYSQDDIKNGCKGSIKVSACEINAHANDHTRIDIIVPGEAHFYLKTTSSSNRQAWLVALGSCKVCTNNLINSNIITEQLHNQATTTATPAATTTKEQQLRSNKTQIKLCFDDICQQAFNIKVALKDKANIDEHLLDDSTTLINASTETFIRCLEECLGLVDLKIDHSTTPTQSKHHFTKEENWASRSMSRRSSESHHNRVITRVNSHDVKKNHHHRQHRLSSFSSSSSSSYQAKLNDAQEVHTDHGGREEVSDDKSPITNFATTNNINNINNNNHNNNNNINKTNNDIKRTDKLKDKYLSNNSNNNNNISNNNNDISNNKNNISNNNNNIVQSSNVKTFFSNRSFNIPVTVDKEIETLVFLNACRDLLKIFDIIDQSSFNPGYLDLISNINRLQEKYNSDNTAYNTVADVVREEVTLMEVDTPNSLSTSILWLLESLDFVRVLLEDLASDATVNTHAYLPNKGDVEEEAGGSMGSLLKEVYAKTLKKHHGFVLQSAFAIATKKLPKKHQLLHKFITLHKNNYINNNKNNLNNINNNNYTTSNNIDNNNKTYQNNNNINNKTNSNNINNNNTNPHPNNIIINNSNINGHVTTLTNNVNDFAVTADDRAFLMLLIEHIRWYTTDMAVVLNSLRCSLHEYALKISADSHL